MAANDAAADDVAVAGRLPMSRSNDRSFGAIFSCCAASVGPVLLLMLLLFLLTVQCLFNQ